MSKVVAIEIDSFEAWETVCALQPHYKELDALANKGNFVVVSTDDPLLEGAILSPGALAAQFDHIEPSKRKLKFVDLVR